MLGTIVNAASIIIGAIMGNFLKGGFPENIKSTIMQGLSITVMLIGLSMALKSQNLLVVTLSIVIGAVLGEVLRIEHRLKQLGQSMERRFGNGDGDFTRAFVSASLLYCVGAMAIMGSLESGLTGNHTTLFIKSILDGVSAVVFSSSLGLGVAFSALPVFLYQGSITLAASYIKVFLTDTIIREMTATGGLLIFAIGINMLGIDVDIKVGNLLPAIFVAVFLAAAFSHMPG
ncbi:MAG: uncharacterized protein PWQ97_496 [Tepidanaerobacteraceae bacterium]|nr:uncharacterized protein [Tepidanaerobacteraceae bacterium]